MSDDSKVTVFTSNRITLCLPAFSEGEWSPEAAVSLVGQQTKIEGLPAKIVSCEVTMQGRSMEVTLEISESAYDEFIGKGFI